MPLEFIPNQPIIFEKPIGDYPCLNNDNKAYGQLMQADDSICIQWKMTPCQEPLCDPDMLIDKQNELQVASVTTGGDWNSNYIDNASYQSDRGDTLTFLWDGLNVACFHKLEFNVTTFSSLGEVIVQSCNGVYLGSITGTGLYTFVVGATPPTACVQWITQEDTPTTIVIENIRFFDTTCCWRDEYLDGTTSWVYEFDENIQQGRFCSNENDGALINVNAIFNVGNYHGVTLYISNCTSGGVEVFLGGVSIGTTSGNGTFNFYGTPTLNNELVFEKINNFNGCISQVKTFDYNNISNYTVYFENIQNTISSNYVVPTPFDDRLVLCVQLSALTWNAFQNPDIVLQCELLITKIYDPCEDIIHSSINHINYNIYGWECTKVVEAWNDNYAFNLYFGDINNPDFKLKQRLRFLAFNPIYKNAGDEYLYSSGSMTRPFIQSQKARKAWFDYVDEYTHDCIRTSLISQKLFIEGYAFYYPTKDYEPEWNDRGQKNLAQSEVELYHELTIFGTTCAMFGNSVCPPTNIGGGQTNLTKLRVDAVNIPLANLQWDVSKVILVWSTYASGGTYTNSAVGTAYDLNSPGDLNQLLLDMMNILDNHYTSSCTGTISYNGIDLSINIEGNASITIPMKCASFALFDGGDPRNNIAIGVIYE